MQRPERVAKRSRIWSAAESEGPGSRRKRIPHTELISLSKYLITFPKNIKQYKAKQYNIVPFGGCNTFQRHKTCIRQASNRLKGTLGANIILPTVYYLPGLRTKMGGGKERFRQHPKRDHTVPGRIPTSPQFQNFTSQAWNLVKTLGLL